MKDVMTGHLSLGLGHRIKNTVMARYNKKYYNIDDCFAPFKAIVFLL